MRNTNKTMAGILFIAFAFLLVFILLSVKTISTLNREGRLLSGKRGSIGVVEVTGIIMDSKKVIELLISAEEDESVGAIIVRINSPGGAVGPSQEIYHEIRRIDEKKPVYASFASVAASGGYYIGSAARKIFANPGSMTGSIGVIMHFMNLERLFNFLKMDPDLIKAGRYKDLGSSERAISDEERELMQRMIDGVHQQFISDILQARKDRVKGNIEDHAQGQIFSGKDAYDLGLVDELLGLHQAGRKIHGELKLKGEFALKYFRKRKRFSVGDVLGGVEGLLFGRWKDNFFNQFPIPMFLWTRP